MIIDFGNRGNGGSTGGGIPEAPQNGKIYGRKNATWTEVTGGTGGDTGVLFIMPDPYTEGATIDDNQKFMNSQSYQLLAKTSNDSSLNVNLAFYAQYTGWYYIQAEWIHFGPGGFFQFCFEDYSKIGTGNPCKKGVVQIDEQGNSSIISIEEVGGGGGDTTNLAKLDGENTFTGYNIFGGSVRFDNEVIMMGGGASSSADIASGIACAFKAGNTQSIDAWQRNIHLGTDGNPLRIVSSDEQGTTQYAKIDETGIYEGETLLSEKYASKTYVDEIVGTANNRLNLI